MSETIDIKSSEDRLLYVVKSKGPQTAGEIGRALGISAPGAQQQLARLSGLGLVEAEDRKMPRGRPRKYWRLTEKGHARFPDRHSDLTLDLLKSTEAVFGAAGVEKLIRHREAETRAAYVSALDNCKDLASRVAGLADIRAREGYLPEWTETGPNEYLFVENHCPICAAARACQGLCRSEIETFQAALGPDVTVARTDHILAGARRCAYEIKPKK